MGELKTKKQYVAVHAINFGKPNPQIKVAQGDLIPEGVKPETIKDLLDHGDIQEVE